MLRTGKVVSAQGGQLEICFDRPEACAHCGACGGEGHHTLVKLPGDAPIGSWVDVEMPDHKVLKASALAYVMPLIMLLLGIWAGSKLFAQEALWAVSGLVFMGLSWLLLRAIDQKMRRRADWQPRILAVHIDQEKQE